ncbi:MAG: hypothetical protein ACI9U2_003274 [Bradymonadia bacterium]|jgi:hypothetical protein
MTDFADVFVGSEERIEQRDPGIPKCRPPQLIWAPLGILDSLHRGRIIIE